MGTISEEFAAFAKNAEDLGIASLYPFRLATLSSGEGGQLFYWLRVAAHALGTTVSVNRAKPPKSERRIIALVNLRARGRSFSLFTSCYLFYADVPVPLSHWLKTFSGAPRALAIFPTNIVVSNVIRYLANAIVWLLCSYAIFVYHRDHQRKRMKSLIK